MIFNNVRVERPIYIKWFVFLLHIDDIASRCWLGVFLRSEVLSPRPCSAARRHHQVGVLNITSLDRISVQISTLPLLRKTRTNKLSWKRALGLTPQKTDLSNSTHNPCLNVFWEGLFLVGFCLSDPPPYDIWGINISKVSRHTVSHISSPAVLWLSATLVGAIFSFSVILLQHKQYNHFWLCNGPFGDPIICKCHEKIT